METQQVNLERVKTYGDHLDDGMIQLSFTLPVPYCEEARKAAVVMASKLGIERPDVVHYERLLNGFTFFIVYGKCAHSVDFTAIELDATDRKEMTPGEIEAFIAENLGGQVVVVGASTGTDTHTVGIDAILNMKGYNGHYGLERYKGIQAYNLGSQVPNEVLVAKAMEVGADAILVSQTVTQQQLHVHNLTELVDLLEAEDLRDDILLICGGPRITNELAKELGYDAGFSKGCLPFHVGSYMVTELHARRAAMGMHPNAYRRAI